MPGKARAQSRLNPRTTLSYELSRPGPVHLAVVDVRGRLVTTLIDEHQSAGTHAITWDGRDYNGGAVLGILNPGTTGLFEYDVRTFVKSTLLSCAGTTCGSTKARIGDPFAFNNKPGPSSIGNLNSFVFTPAVSAPPGPPGPTAVPEPGTAVLFLLGLATLLRVRR